MSRSHCVPTCTIVYVISRCSVYRRRGALVINCSWLTYSMNSISYKYPSEYLSEQLVLLASPSCLFNPSEKRFGLLLCLCYEFSARIEMCKHTLNQGSGAHTAHLPDFPFNDWICLLFTTCLLVLYLLGGSLSVVFRCSQLVTVDSQVKRNLTTENSELPRPSTG